jgi:hypothetical protein
MFLLSLSRQRKAYRISSRRVTSLGVLNEGVSRPAAATVWAEGEGVPTGAFVGPRALSFAGIGLARPGEFVARGFGGADRSVMSSPLSSSTSRTGLT